jgi:hypothetical protein
MYDEHCRSWVVIRIGTGYIIEPRSVGVHGPWSHWDAFCALLSEQGRSPEVMSVQTRRRLAGVYR